MKKSEGREIHLSVIVPAYNEANRIGASLAQIVAFLQAQSFRSEIIVVDDGSTDATVAVAVAALSAFPHEIIRNSKNLGKGHAVKTGMAQGRGSYLLFTDADLSTPISEVLGFMEQLEQGYDLVIGSRDLKNSRVEVHQGILRESMGKVFNLLARALSFHGIQDSQCGFKCFKHAAAKDLFGRQKLDGFSFDAEILYLAQKKGYRILEAPVTWRNSFQTRVKVFRDPILMFLDLARIRFLHRHEK